MKEYRVFQVRCEKGTTIHNLFSLIDKEVVYHDVFFELSGVHSGRAAKQPFNTSSEFYHSFQANDHNNNIWKVFSNLNNNWKWENPHNTRSLSPGELHDLIDFADRAGPSQYGMVMLGFDGIEWDPGCITSGTYGYEKAVSLFAGGYNYLSNSIIISKDNFSKGISCYIACESKYQNTPNLQKMLKALGKLVYEETFFAPSDLEERPEWERRYEKAKSDFSAMRSTLPDFFQTLPSYQEFPDPPKNVKLEEIMQAERDAPTLNTKKISRPAFQANGWQAAKTKHWAICYEKACGDGTVLAIIDSTHRGHMLQTLLQYKSVYFSFVDNINFIKEPLTVEESQEYFNELMLVLNYAVSFLNGTADNSPSHEKDNKCS